MYTTEYNNVTGLLIGEDYIFTATQSGVDVYITITDTSDTVIEHGPSPLTVNNITASSVRLHATNDAACGSSSTCTATTMQYILSCPQPVSLTAFNMTESSADLEWTEEGSATTWDIEWGTMGFAPTGTPNITGVTSNPYTLTGLTSGTVYSFYVRSDCGVDDGTSIWSGPFAFQTTADCSGSLLDITSTTNGGVCNEGIATLQATASGTGSEIYWYDAEFDGNLVGEGTSFETPFLTETTSYWASEVLHNNNLLSGQAFANPTTFTNSTSNAGGVLFNVALPMKIVDVEVFGTNATGGDITIELRDVDNGNITIASTTATITGGGTAANPIPHTIPLDFYVEPGNYRLVRTAATPTGVGMGYVSAANSSFPYPLGSSGSVTGGATATGTSTIQYFFFNWTIEEISLLCFSDREEVIATVHEIIDIDVSATETTIDFGGSTTLTVSSTNTNYMYEWTWNGGTDTGATITVSPTEHTTYTITATDSVTGCQVSKEIEISVYDMALCDTIEILTTTNGNICDEGTVALNATASGTGSEIYWYDAAVDGNKVGQGTSFETPELTETTSYWAAEVYLDEGAGVANIGESDPSIGTSSATNLTNHGMHFTVLSSTTLVSVEIFPTAAIGSNGTIIVRQGSSATGTIIATVPYTTTVSGTVAAPIAQTVMLDIPLDAGDYTLMQGTGINLIRNTTGGTYPHTSNIAEITGHTFAGASYVAYWYFFYNWQFGSDVVICESDREEVIASVHETIGIDVTATETDLLPGESTTLTASSTNSNYEYVWTWDGGTATGASVTVSPTAISTIYTVTATDTVTGCQTQGSIEIFTFDPALCDDLEIATTTDGNVCDPGNTTTLQATGSSSMGDAQIFWYDAPTGGNKVGTGTTFTTPALTTTTSYYAAEVLTDGQGIGGTISTDYTAGGLTFFAATTGVGITFAIQNTNSVPVTLNGLDFYMDAGTNQSYQLWYNATSITGAPGIINAANGWVSIAGPQNAAPTDTVNGVYPVFTGIDFEIPANTTYRFALTGTGAGNFSYYNATGAPNSFSSEGINLLVGDNSAGGTGNVGYSGQNPYTTGITTNPRFFHGGLSFSSATILCESDREEVTATVYEIIDIDVTATETTLDAGDSTTLTASSTNSNYEYVWTWDGGTPLTGASVTVSPTEHTIFTVTATDTVTGCQTSEEIEILVYDMTLCNTIEILTTTDGSVCDEGIVTLEATATGDGSEIYWYDASVGGNKVGEGSTFETPTLTSTTSYWAAEVYLDGETITGVGIVTPSGTGTNSTVGYGVQFTVTEPTTLASVDVLSTANGGDLTIGLYDVSTSTYIASHVETIIAGQYHTIPLNFDVPAAGTYRLVRQAQSTTIALRSQNTTGTEYPYPIGTIGQLDGGHVSLTGTVNSGQYMFYNWTFDTAVVICESDREEVIASVHETIDIDVTSTDTELLPGESATLSASSTNTNYIYEWTWDGGSETGASITVSPTAISTIYTVTATDTVTGCQTQGSIEIFTFDPALCDDLEIATTIDGNVCDPGNTTTLQATGSSSMGDAQIFWYDAPTGGNKVGTGPTFTTPPLTTTTSYYAAEVLTDEIGRASGRGWTTDYGTLGVGTTRQGLIFEIFEHTTLVDLEVWSTGAGGVVDIELYDMANVVVGNHLELVTTTLATGTTTSPAINTVTLNWELAPGVYKIVRAGSVPCRYISGVANFGGGYPIPFDNGIGQITAGSNTFASTGYATAYYYFFNWTLSTAEILCESDREEVIATVHDIIGIDVTATETTIDFGDNTTLTASSTNTNYEYVWTWDGGTATGASVTVSPAEHTTYTVTATDTVTGCQTSEEIEILVYDLTLCDSIEILTTTAGSICNDGTVTLSATASGDGDEIYWYDAQTGGNLVGQGATFTTPELAETVSYWASEVYLDAPSLTGQAFANPTTFTNSTSNAGGVLFTVTKQMKIVDVQVFGTNATGGEITIELRNIDNGNVTVATTTATITGGGTATAPIPHTITLNFDVPPGNYRLVRTGATPTGVGMGYVTAANSDFPYPLGVSGQVTGGATATGTSTIQYFFFNWTIEEDHVICESEREEVTATVHNIDIAATATTIDPGDSVTLTASSTNPNYTYEWTWDGGSATGATITVTPSSHTTYTVTATDSTDPTCQNSAEIQIIVFSTTLCNMLEITSTTDGGICESGSTVLQATGGGTGDNIYWYDAATGGNLVGQGTEFTTPNLTTTTSFWASEVLLADGQGVATGQAKLTPDTTTGYTQNAGLEFVATDSFTIVDVEAYSNAVNGTSIPSLELQDASGNVLQSISNVPIPNGGVGVNAVPFTITLNFNVPGPGTYRLIATGGSFSSLLRDSGASNAQFPHNVGDVAVVTQGVLTNNPTTTSYYYFYNWTVSSGLVLCESDRMEAVALVVPQSSTPPPTGDANQLVSAGTTLAGLNVTGTELTWYSDAALTNEVPDTTLAYEGTYYVTQTLGYCEGLPLAITVTLLCPTPTNLTATPTSLTEVTLSWTGGGDSFEVEWGPAGFTLGNGSSITGLTTNSTNVTTVIDTPYEFYVRQDCGIEGISL